MRTVAFALAAVLLVPSVAPAKTKKVHATKEIIALVLVDAMRPDHMSSYGYDRPTTPFMDTLAEQGRRYTNVFANAPWTRPSTASFLTGLNASRHTAETDKSKLADSVNTLAKRMKAAGYTTAGFTANGNGGSLANLGVGFDVFRDPTNTYTKKKRGKTYNGLPTGPFLVKDALKWIRTTDAEKLFLFLFLVDPHDPYYAPPKLEAMFLGKDFTGKTRRRALWERNNDYGEDERYSMLAFYDAGIRYSDQALETFYKGLGKLGLREKTTTFISADHGEGFGEHGFYLHAHHFWDEVIKIPLIAHGPGVEPGVDERLTQSLDVAAAIAKLGGASTNGLPGYSVLDPVQHDRHVISEYNEFGIHRQAVMTDLYKVIWQRPADEAWYMRAAKKKEFFPSVSFDKEVIRVFDRTKDPGERADLAANPPAKAQAALAKLRAFVTGH